MANLKIQEKQIRAARALSDMEKQATAAVTQLKAIKINLLNFKGKISGDSDFDLAAENSIQEVIDSIQVDISTI